MPGHEFHLKNFALSVGQAVISIWQGLKVRWDFNSLITWPTNVINIIWVRPKMAVVAYLDLWNWDHCDP